MRLTPEQRKKYRQHDGQVAIPGFSGYFITKDGDVFGPLNKLKPRLTNCGYFQVCIKKDGDDRHKNQSVNRLVLMTFSGHCPKGMDGAHLNGIKTDNRIDNLVWVTRTENHFHKRRHGTHVEGSKCYNAILSETKVSEIKRLLRIGIMKQREIAKQFGIHEGRIYEIKTGKHWKHVV
jgi:hypothetical protein